MVYLYEKLSISLYPIALQVLFLIKLHKKIFKRNKFQFNRSIFQII